MFHYTYKSIALNVLFICIDIFYFWQNSDKLFQSWSVQCKYQLVPQPLHFHIKYLKINDRWKEYGQCSVTMISNLITPDLYFEGPGFKCSPGTGYPDRFSCLWSSIHPNRYCNGTSNQATATSFHILFNSLFTTDAIIGYSYNHFHYWNWWLIGGDLHSFIYQTMQWLYRIELII